MAIKDKNCHPTLAHFTFDPIDATLVTTAASQTNTPFYAFTPGFDFIVQGVQYWNMSHTNITSLNVLLGLTAGSATSCLASAITPTSNPSAPVAATLATSRSSLIGSAPTLSTAGTTIFWVYSSGTGQAAANFTLTVVVRPRRMDGEAN